MSIIKFDGVSFKYSEDEMALDDITLSVEKGEFVAIIGHNGSGKSTLAKHINALFIPTDGVVEVLGMSSADEGNIQQIRQHAGMVFQNPDNQMVTSIVEEDVAFGPENLGMDPAEIRTQVDKSLSVVGMLEYSKFAPHRLSGGQKQRIAIAGVLAMRPDILILDEATAMLDPSGRQEILDTAIKLNKEQGITLVLITHFMEEATLADRIIVVSDGKIAMQGTPVEIFSRGEELSEIGLDMPFTILLSKKLREQGFDIADELDPLVLADRISQMVLEQKCQ